MFCSDSHTAKGHVAIGNSAERLLQGGRVAVAIAPVDLAERSDGDVDRQIVAIGDSDGGARETAQALAAAFGARVEPVAGADTSLLVIDSRPEVEVGRVGISLGFAPDRDRDLPGARAPARRTPAVRTQHRRNRCLTCQPSEQRARPCSAYALAACTGEPVARQRFGEVERAANEMTGRTAPEPRLGAALGRDDAGWH